MIKELNIFKSIINEKSEPYIGVEFSFYKKWFWLLPLFISLNKKYIPCLIFRKKYKLDKNLVIIALKSSGKNVKRRTQGFAKEFIDANKSPRCVFCKGKLNYQNATTDHIVPISERGTNAQVNLVVCCDKCNTERGKLDFLTYYKKKNPQCEKEKYIFI